MKAMLFSAGYGTRMAPLSDQLPKPAMPFYGRPLVAHSLEWLARQGIGEVVLNLHHLGEVARKTAEAHAPVGMTLHFSAEPELLGTGGGLVLARDYFPAEGGPFVVVNGDIFSQIDLRVPLRVHRHWAPTATLVLNSDAANEALFGVGLDLDKRILDFWGEPPGPGAFRRCAFTGIQIVDPCLFDTLPATGFACIKEAGYLPVLHDGGRLQGAVVDAPWFDLGTPARYLAAHLSMLGKLQELARRPMLGARIAAKEPPPPTLTVVPPVVLGARLRVEGEATVGPAAFLGDDVTLGDGAQVVRTVVWDGATVRGRVSDAICAPGVGAVSA